VGTPDKPSTASPKVLLPYAPNAYPTLVGGRPKRVLPNGEVLSKRRKKTVAPATHLFKKGVGPGAEKIPRSAGYWIRFYTNNLIHKGYDEPTLRRIAKDEYEKPAKRAAAIRIVRMLEQGDMADFEPFINGLQSLAELKAGGINTEVVKKAKVGEKGVEVELHDRSGAEFDRLINQTDGTPTQRMDMSIQAEVIQKPDERLLQMIGWVAGRLQEIRNTDPEIAEESD
jgi:hypothetical protein